jgi:hypothetical protein
MRAYHGMHNMRRRPSKPTPQPVPLGVQALSELRRDEFDATPFGVRSEIAEVRPAEPPSVPPEPLRIEPPDWDAETAARGESRDPCEGLTHTRAGQRSRSGLRHAARCESPACHACDIACATRRCSWNGSALALT